MWFEDSVAVVGMAGRYVGADDLGAFWRRIRHGTKVDVQDYHSIFIQVPPPAPNRRVEPSLLFASHALYATRCALNQWRQNGSGSSLRKGVWAAQNVTHTRITNGEHRSNLVTRSLAAGLARRLDCRAMALDVDTECASVAVAVQSAVWALLADACDVAVVCAVRVGLEHELVDTVLTQQAADGQAPFKSLKIFEHGWRLAEAAGAVVLRRYREAANDGDTIQGVIRAVECGHQGKPHTLAGNLGAYTDLITRALTKARVDPAEVAHVELDYLNPDLQRPAGLWPLVAFGQVLAPPACAPSVAVTVDTAGHVQAAIGMAALHKCLLALAEESLPPTINAEFYEPALEGAAPHFRMPLANTPWRRGPRSRSVCLGGCSGSGMTSVIVLSDQPARSS